MSVNKPLKRTVRIFADGEYAEGGRWLYILNKQFAQDPQHYIRAFLLIQDDLKELFNYIEPADQNQGTFSLRIQQLLMRVCVEFEANCTAAAGRADPQTAARHGLKLADQPVGLVEIGQNPLATLEIGAARLGRR